MTAVGIVIPCYDLGEFLPEAVESARAQTRPPSEILIVDDGSTDEHTLEILGTYRRERGVRVLRKRNGGAPSARNFGIRRTRAELVLCLDADDVLEPSFLEETVPVLESALDTGIVTTHVEFFGDRDGTWRVPDHDPVRLLWQNSIASASLFRRTCWEQVGGYKRLAGCQDWEFWISIVERGWRWAVVERPLYRYRIRRGSISQFREEHREEIVRKVVDLHIDTYRNSVADVVVAMDAELQRLRTHVARLESEKRAAGLLPTPSPARAVRPTASNPVTEAEREALQELIRTRVPQGACVAVVGDAELDLDERELLRLDTGEHADDSVVRLERARTHGAEFLLVPAASRSVLDSKTQLGPHVEARYPRVVSEGGPIVHDLTEYRTFSVVVCTYNRAAFVEKALYSLFAQDYPRDRFEIIVIDNGSTDETGEVVLRSADSSPVPFSYAVESRNGLSYARNTGIAKARFEYVAFLDDDATACETWLRSFNRVINRHHALVVGGRVEKALPDGFTPPGWFQYQYTRGFFGLNYREWGKQERVFRIRYPRYIGGGNSVYARRLFDHFEGFSTDLGRGEKGLLAAEETYLNLVLDRADIPIYYTDDAVINHFVDGRRLNKRHLVRKAWWSGISNALMYGMFFGADALPEHMSQSILEARRLVGRVGRAPRDPENVSRLVRLVYCTSFLRKGALIRLRHRLGRRRYEPVEVEGWPAERWLEEISSWADSPERNLQLYHLHLASGDDAEAEAALGRLAADLPDGLPEDDDLELDTLVGPLRRLRYERMIGCLRELVDETLPGEARVIVVSRGDERLLDLNGREAWHFPRDASGVYAGYYPATCEAAVAHLEELRARGGDFLVFPSTAFWWFDQYPKLRLHLEQCYRSIARDERGGEIFSLVNGRRSPANATGPRTAAGQPMEVQA